MLRFFFRLVFPVSMIGLLFGMMNSSLAKDQTCPKVLDHGVAPLGSAQPQSLCDYQGQVILAVNTASQCGFTPQFEGLEKLYQTYKDQGLVVLGFPSNSFYQESRDAQSIAEFCKLNYGVTFPMMSKIEVKGDKAHGFYQSLAEATGQPPKWNFFKYLIDRDGAVVLAWSSMVQPKSEDLQQAIQKALAGAGHES